MGVASVSEAYFVFGIGLLLALNSGYINGLCLSGLLTEEGSDKVNVSAVTRAYTESGLNLVSGLYDEFGFAFSIILSFVAGACVSGLLNPEATPHKLVPSYGPTFLIGSICLIAASFAADMKPSGHSHYFLAAAANGLQNGISSIYTANLIRTSHHTGTSTDIGIIIGQILRGNWKNYWKLKVLIGLASSFWVGGLISFYSATAFLHDSLWFSTALFMVIGISHLTFVVLTEKVSYFQAAYGTWKWEVILSKVASTMNETSNDSYGKSRTLTEDQIDFVFDEMDASGSGTINADELKSALEKMGKRLTRKNVLAMMAVVDLEDDGGINRQVFRTLVNVAALRSSQRQEREHSSLLRSISLLSFGEDTSLSLKPLSRSASATFGKPLFVGKNGLIDRRPSDPTLSSRPLFRSISATFGVNLFVVGTKSNQSLDQIDWMPEHLHSTNNNNRTTPNNAKEEKKKEDTTATCVSSFIFNHDEEDPVKLHSLSEDDDDGSYATQPPRLTYQEYHPPSGNGDTAHAIIVTDVKYPYAIVDIKELSGTIQQSVSNLIQGPNKNLGELPHATIDHDVQGASVHCRKEDMMIHNLMNRGRLFDTRKVEQAGEEPFYVWTLTNIGQLGADNNMTGVEDSKFDEQDVLSF